MSSSIYNEFDVDGADIFEVDFAAMPLPRRAERAAFRPAVASLFG